MDYSQSSIEFLSNLFRDATYSFDSKNQTKNIKLNVALKNTAEVLRTQITHWEQVGAEGRSARATRDGNEEKAWKEKPREITGLTYWLFGHNAEADKRFWGIYALYQGLSVCQLELNICVDTINAQLSREISSEADMRAMIALTPEQQRPPVAQQSTFWGKARIILSSAIPGGLKSIADKSNNEPVKTLRTIRASIISRRLVRDSNPIFERLDFSIEFLAFLDYVESALQKGFPGEELTGELIDEIKARLEELSGLRSSLMADAIQLSFSYIQYLISKNGVDSVVDEFSHKVRLVNSVGDVDLMRLHPIIGRIEFKGKSGAFRILDETLIAPIEAIRYAIKNFNQLPEDDKALLIEHISAWSATHIKWQKRALRRAKDLPVVISHCFSNGEISYPPEPLVTVVDAPGEILNTATEWVPLQRQKYERWIHDFTSVISKKLDSEGRASYRANVKSKEQPLSAWNEGEEDDLQERVLERPDSHILNNSSFLPVGVQVETSLMAQQALQGMNSIFTQEELEVLRLRQIGWKVKQIAEMTNFTEQQIDNLQQKFAYQRPKLQRLIG